MRPDFMTGVFGEFDRARVERETRAGFRGLEISCLRSYEEADRVFDFAKDTSLSVGVHFPLVRGAHPGVNLHAWLTSRDPKARSAGFDAVDRELDVVERAGTEYMIVHYPKPAILKTGLDWSDWRIQPGGEALDGAETSEQEQEDLSFAAFERLSRLAQGSRVKLVVEHDILNPMHYAPLNEEALLVRLFKGSPGLGFCADLGRLHLLEWTDSEFDACRFLTLMLPLITNVHVWTVQVGTNRYGGHLPVHPSLHKEDGWGDMAGLLDIISSLPHAHVMFEHRADLVSDQYLDETYAWVASMLNVRRPDLMTR